MLQLSAGVLCSLQLISWLASSESPRWLLAQRRHDKFLSLIFKASKQNGRLVKTSTIMAVEGQTEDLESVEGGVRLQYSALYESPQLLVTLSLLVLWPVTAIGYYGISLSMSSIGESAFLNNALAALIEIPSYVILTALMDLTGRRPLFVFSLLFTGLTCLGAGLSASLPPLQTTFALLGKLCSSASFSLTYIMTAEIIPTSLRTSALGTCSVMARLGAILAPQLALLLPSLTPLPSLHLYIFSLVSLLGSLLAIVLPDTVNTVLPDTFEQVDSTLRLISVVQHICKSKIKILFATELLHRIVVKSRESLTLNSESKIFTLHERQKSKYSF